MTKPVSEEDIANLNSLLNDTLQQADKEHLISCVRILGTAVASLKINNNVDEATFQHEFKNLVSHMQDETKAEKLNQIFSKSIIECATAIAVAKNVTDNN